jgi:hypothetical protein
MTDRPIIFSAAMVRALLSGGKTQTRRLGTSPLAKCQIGDRLYVREAFYDGRPYFTAHAADWPEDLMHPHESLARNGPCHWKPSIHMPRWASRLTLTVTEVRRQSLQSITEPDAQAEGMYRSYPDDEDREWFDDHQREYTGEAPTEADWEQFNEGVWMVPGLATGWGLTKADRRKDQWAPTAACGFKFLWNSLHDKPGQRWDDNPEIVALTFTVERANIDALARAA